MDVARLLARVPRGRAPRQATVRIRVKGGFEPDTVLARANEPLRLVFRREETASCSERVVLPAFGRSATLPPFEDVTLELLPEHEGEYEFTCQLGVLRGLLVVVAGSPNGDEWTRS
jgi:plastocyanin domain-containing protein